MSPNERPPFDGCAREAALIAIVFSLWSISASLHSIEQRFSAASTAAPVTSSPAERAR